MSSMLDPDVRFLLANERTLLAWVRTALALMAGGLALGALGDRSVVLVASGLLAIALGAAMSVIGYVRFKTADKAIRRGKLPEMGSGPALQVAVVIGFAAIVSGIILVRVW